MRLQWHQSHNGALIQHRALLILQVPNTPAMKSMHTSHTHSHATDGGSIPDWPRFYSIPYRTDRGSIPFRTWLTEVLFHSVPDWPRFYSISSLTDRGSIPFQIWLTEVLFHSKPDWQRFYSIPNQTDRGSIPFHTGLTEVLFYSVPDWQRFYSIPYLVYCHCSHQVTYSAGRPLGHLCT